MNKAVDCHDFHNALRNFGNPSQNVVYADIAGNIGYTINGRVPVRAKGDGSIPVPGWTGEFEWIGDIPLEEIPHVINPPKGFIVTANNQPEPRDLSRTLGRDFLTSERAGRITELLEAKQKVDIAYIKSMHRDQVAISARMLGHALGNLEVHEPDLREVVAGMKEMGWQPGQG